MAAGRPVAIGIRPHTGWGAVVALGGPAAGAEVLDRRRIDLATTFAEGAVYHQGQSLSLPEAEAFARDSARRFERLAREALEALLADLRSTGCRPAGCAVVGGSGRPLPPLASILRSHPLVHAAEAELYRGVLARAAEATGLATRLVPAADLSQLAAAALQIATARVDARLAALGKAAGRPWGKDQKEAALAAWCALG